MLRYSDSAMLDGNTLDTRINTMILRLTIRKESTGAQGM
jgi:hypothetical protein